MASIWVESLGRSFEEALGLLSAAIPDCTDELWESSTWKVPAPDADADLHGPDGCLVTTPTRAVRWFNGARRRGAWRGTRSKCWTTT